MSRNIPNLQPSEDLGILVGLLLTDGCVSHKQLIFHNNSEEMHELFKEKVTSVFGMNKFTEGIERNGVRRTQLSAKKAIQELLRFCELETFRRKPFKNGEFPNIELPKFIKELSKNEICKILQSMFSSDGSISLSARWHKTNNSWEIRRRVELSCKHPIIRKQLIDLLKSIGLSPVNSSNENITIEKIEDIKKFKEIIGFVKGIKIGKDSKNWDGFEKNQILSLAIRTMEFSKKDLQHFRTKEEVIDFLKSFLLSVDN